jgi:hypothetical protein
VPNCPTVPATGQSSDLVGRTGLRRAECREGVSAWQRRRAVPSFAAPSTWWKAATNIKGVFFTVDQAQVRGTNGLEELGHVGERAAATGNNVEIWEAAHSLRSGWLCLTAWWESLAALEPASEILADTERHQDRSQKNGIEAVPAPVEQRLLTVIAGPTEFNQAHKYLRILEISALKDMQAAIDNGVEFAQKVSNITGISMTLLRNVTGFSRDMMFLSTYESLAQYEDAGHHLEATSYWFHQRSQYNNVLDGSTLAMNLFRRLPSGSRVA